MGEDGISKIELLSFISFTARLTFDPNIPTKQEKISNDISEYPFPIVVVAKRSAYAACICGDFKVSVNKALIVETYLLPRLEELLSRIGNCK